MLGRKLLDRTTYVVIFFYGACSPIAGYDLLILEVLEITQSDTPDSVGLLWTSDQPVSETSTWQHTTLTTDKHPCPRAGFETTVSAGERPQTYAVDSPATGTGTYVVITTP